MSDLADLMQDILGCVPGKGDRCLVHGHGWPCDVLVDAESRVQAWHEAEVEAVREASRAATIADLAAAGGAVA